VPRQLAILTVVSLALAACGDPDPAAGSGGVPIAPPAPDDRFPTEPASSATGEAGGDSSATPIPDVVVKTLDRALAPPVWARRHGRDRAGYWAEIAFAGQTQRLRLVLPGTFRMGNTGSNLRVTLTRPLWLADHECTIGQWRAVMGSLPDDSPAEDERPVTRVSWRDVTAQGTGFLDRLNELVPKLNARLPTEAEWAYACRAGCSLDYSDPEAVGGNGAAAGPDEDDTGQASGPLAWHTLNSDGRPHRVKTRRPNGWGLFDMHGNVSEWCADAFTSNLGAGLVTDPLKEGGTGRVVRGGGYVDYPSGCTIRSRSGNAGDSRNEDIGFRIAVTAR